MSIDVTVRLSSLVESIKGYQTLVGNEALRLRTPELRTNFDKLSPRCWCRAALGDSLVRVRLLLEQNFNFIESLGVVAVSRYLFELSVWLYLFEEDERYGLLYYGQLLDTQQKYYSDYIAQLLREIQLLNAFQEKERKAQDAIDVKLAHPKGIGQKMRQASQIIDAEAARKFSLYAEHAKTNGYGFQAYLVEKKALPQAEKALQDLREEQQEFDANVLPKIQDLALTNGKKRRWEWKKMAECVGLTSEYEFIYAFSSKLLHATPASITTDQKNLEPEEMIVFLKYIEVKIMDILEIARKQTAIA